MQLSSSMLSMQQAPNSILDSLFLNTSLSRSGGDYLRYSPIFKDTSLQLPCLSSRGFSDILQFPSISFASFMRQSYSLVDCSRAYWYVLGNVVVVKYSWERTLLMSALILQSFQSISSNRSCSCLEKVSGGMQTWLWRDFWKIRYSEPPVKGGYPVFRKQNTPAREQTSLTFSDAVLWIVSGGMQLGVPTKCSNTFLFLSPFPEPLISGLEVSLAVPKSTSFIQYFSFSRIFQGLMSLWIISNLLWSSAMALTSSLKKYLQMGSEMVPNVLDCSQISPTEANSIWMYRFTSSWNVLSI